MVVGDHLKWDVDLVEYDHAHMITDQAAIVDLLKGQRGGSPSQSLTLMWCHNVWA